MNARAILVLDVSRLVSRTKRGSPTGIDRVELDEAERVLASDREACFFATRGPRSWFIPRVDIARLVHGLRARWSGGTDVGRNAARAVYGFLGIGSQVPEPGVSAPAMPAIAGPRAVPSVLLTRRLERLLQDPETRVTYRNVSHHYLDQDGLIIGLKDRWQARIEVFWHDAIPILWPEYFREGDSEKHHRRLSAVLSYADSITVNSHATRNELAFLALERRQSLPPVTVRPLTPPKVFSGEIARLETARPFFIVVGTIEPRKNHRMLLEVWRELARERGPACPALVLAGRRGWMNSDTFALLDRSPALKDHVIEAPELCDEVLAGLMRSAEALLMPSFAEGFGLPLVEAQELGTPVIASDLPVFREVARHPFVALPPLAGQLWKEKITELVDGALGAHAASRQGL